MSDLKAPLGVTKLLERQLADKENLTMVTRSTMPSNVVNVQKYPKPATEPKFKVVEEGNTLAQFTSPTAWHSYDKAYQLHKRGKNVDVLVWDEFVGKHVPTSEATGYDKVNEYGEVIGNWKQVVQGRASRKTGQKVEHKGVAIDEETVRMLGNIATISKSSATALRLGKLTNKDMFTLREYYDLLVRHLDSKIDDQDPSLAEVGDVTL